MNERGIYPIDITKNLSKYPKGMAEIETMSNGDYRYIPRKEITPSTFMLYENTTLLFIWDKPYFVIKISSKSVTNSYRKYFEYFWKIAKK